MPWIWGSLSGALFTQDGPTIAFVASGYAGHGAGVNNPLYEDTPNVGPLPQGWYTIGTPRDHPRLGKYVLPLIPDANNKMHGRSAFFCHGDNTTPEAFDGSYGCIVLARSFRERLGTSSDKRLRVVDL